MITKYRRREGAAGRRGRGRKRTGPLLCMLVLLAVLPARAVCAAQTAAERQAAYAAETTEAGAAAGERPTAYAAQAPEGGAAGAERPTAYAAETPEGGSAGAERQAADAAQAPEEGSASEDEEATPITMEVVCGYGGHARGGRYVPVEVSLENGGSLDFSGKLRFLTMESDYDIYQYEYPADVPAGQRTDRLVYIPVGNRADQLFVSLTDEEEHRILRRRVQLQFSLEVPELFVGILSDTPELLSGWDGVGVDYSMLRTVTVPFETAAFPTDEMGLDMIDVLLISNYRIRDLSAEQSQTLVEWVRSGGTMILGTGARADDTLGRFAPELLEESYDPPVTREVDMGDEYAQDRPTDATLYIPCLNFSLSGGDILISDEEQALVAAAPYGRGTIAVAAFDFTDVNDFIRRNPSYLDRMLTGILGDEKIGSLSQAVYSGNSDPYWSVRDMINTGNVRRLPNLALYTLEIGIYILLAGVIVYIFLRQRDLTDYYRRSVAVLSLLFTGIIYFMGSRTRFTDTFYTYAQFVETTYDSVSETSYMNVRAPYNRPYRATLSPEYAVKPVTRSFYSEENAPGFTGSEDYRVGISFEDDRTVLSFRDIPAFEPRYFQLTKSADNADGIGFEGEIEVDGGRLTGTVTNCFREPVENCVLLFNHSLLCLGDLEPGETAAVDDLELLTYPKDASYQVAAFLSGESAFEQADISDEEYVRAAEKTNLLRFYLDNHMPYFTLPVARIVGFADISGENGGFVRNRNDEGITVVSSAVQVYPADEEKIYRSALLKTPRVLGGSYDADTNSLYGLDPVTLEYFLGSDVEIGQLYFDYVSDVFLEPSAGGDLAPFAGKIYFYNRFTGVYDEKNILQTEFSRQDLDLYLSDENTLTVRYVYENRDQYNWNILLPMLNIAGREY